MKGKCPFCDKENIVQNIGRSGLDGKSAFCNYVCESNYRYKMRHADPLTGDKPSNDRINKI